MPDYDKTKHYHNFAIWAASRAAGRGAGTEGLTLGVWNDAFIEAFGENDWKIAVNANPKKFDEAYCDLIDKLLKAVCTGEIKIKFGRAAKFLAVYQKAICKHHPNSLYSKHEKFAHPPIDRILLKNVASKHNQKVSWTKSKPKPWTKLSRKTYLEIVAELRGVLCEKEPFWMIEKYWEPAQ